MKFEVLMLRGLFVACLAVCGLILGAMVSAKPDTVRLAASAAAGQVVMGAHAECMLPPDGVVCPRING